MELGHVHKSLINLLSLDVSESEPWGETPKPPVMGRLRPPTPPPDQVDCG